MLRSARRVRLREEPEDQALALEVGEVDGLARVGGALEVGGRVTDREEIRVGHEESLEEGAQHEAAGALPQERPFCLRLLGDCKRPLEGGVGPVHEPEGEHEVGRGTCEDADVPYLMMAEDIGPGVGALLDVDDGSAGVRQATEREPSHRAGAELGEHPVAWDEAHPPEPEVEDGGELVRALDPDDLENDPREREGRNETEEKEAPRAVGEVEDGGSVGPTDQEEDRAVIEAAEPAVSALSEVEEVIAGGGEEDRDEGDAVGRHHCELWPVIVGEDTEGYETRNGEQQPEEMGQGAQRVLSISNTLSISQLVTSAGS